MLGHRTLSPLEYVDILKRRWWIILLPLLIGPIITYSYSRTLHPLYLSQTLVLIEGQKVPDNFVRPVITAGLDSRLASMKEQILSRSHLQPILERYNLYSSLHLDLDERLQVVRQNVLITPVASGFYIAFIADDPRTAQLVCSDITSLFLNENLRLREASAEGTTDFLKSQLDEAKRNLDDQDAKLAEFQRQYMGKLPGDESANSNVLGSLNTQLEAANQAIARLQQDKSYEEAMLAQQAQTSSAPGAPASAAPTPLEDAYRSQLQALQAQEGEMLLHYTADYPDVAEVRRKEADVRKKLDQEISASKAAPKVAATPNNRQESPAVRQLRAHIDATEVGIQEKRKEQAALQSNMRTYQERLESTPDVAARYKELTRDFGTAQAFYDELLTKMNQSKMATDLEKRQQGEQFRVMDAANLPDAPFYPKRTSFILGGLAGGLALGLLIVGLLEYRDTSLHSERDVWAFTKLPTLGMIAFSDGVTPREIRLPRKSRMFGFRRSKQIVGTDG